MRLSESNHHTIESAIRAVAHELDAADLYYGHGTDNALDEATWLVLSAAGLSPALEPDYQHRLDAASLEACRQLLQQRIETRAPLAYLTGSAWFAGHRFLSDQRALVPRSPLAEFIVSDFYGLLDECEAPRILDLCTGSACIAIASAYARMDAAVLGSDISAEALALARDNVAMHGMEDHVTLVQSDLFESVEGRFDLILSNPPYVDAADLDSMPEEFRHEPALGLAAGGDGLDLVRTILAEAADYLNPGGSLIVEVGNSAEALVAARPDLPFQWLSFDYGGDGVFLLQREELLTRR